MTKTLTFSDRFQAAQPAKADATALSKAKRLLATLPDHLPEPDGLPLGSRMPLKRNRLFVGRAKEFPILAATLKQGGAAAIGQSPAITGWGGIGKSQLAAELVWRYGRFFAGGVFWLSFAEAGGVAGEITACGERMTLHPEYDDLPLDEQVALVSARWQDGLPRLLVFDNCEDPELFEAWCPPQGQCRVILTSRRAHWPAETGVTPLTLGILARHDSITLLRNHDAGRLSDTAALDEIAQELGDLPLALHLAGSYLAQFKVSPAEYLTAIRAAPILEHASMTLGGASPTRHEQHVARTFALSTQKLDPEADALAALALIMAAHFAPGEPLPHWLLAWTLGKDWDDAAPRLEVQKALSRLADLGLVELLEEGPRLHRLVAAFVARDLAIGKTLELVERAVYNATATQNETGLPRPLLVWQPHLRHIAEIAAARGGEDAADLMDALGSHLGMMGDYGGAKAAHQRAVAIAEPTQAPETATYIGNFGLALYKLGDTEGAKTALQRALVMGETAHGPDHPTVAIRLNNLGTVLQDLGDHDGALTAIRRALTITEAALGPNHPTVATLLNNLAGLLHKRGDLAGAETAFQQALTIHEQAHGPDHPDVALNLNNLGLVLYQLGDQDGAQSHLERAVAIATDTLGPDHPDTQSYASNLADLLAEMAPATPVAEPPADEVGEEVLLTIVYTDIVGSTAQTQTLGQKAMKAAKAMHFKTLTRLAEQGGGRVVKSLGDGLLLVFREATAALGFGRAAHADPGDARLSIRVGVHCGKVTLLPDGDIDGPTANYAARVQSACADDGIMVSDAAKRDVEHDLGQGQTRFAFQPVPPQELKGFAGLHTLWRLG